MLALLFKLLMGLLSLVWLFITIGVLVSLWQRKPLGVGIKIVWTLVVIKLPILGALLYILFGGDSAK